MDRRLLPLLILSFVFLVALVLAPRTIEARGGHGAGITFPTATRSGEEIETTVNFESYRHSMDERIEKDFNLLLSDSVSARIESLGVALQVEANKVLEEFDDTQSNEFNLPFYDFELVYNYFARPDYPYGQRPGQDPPNVLFSLNYPPMQQSHVDFYLAGYEAELSAYGYAGVYPSSFWDWDEDSTSLQSTYNLNSVQGYDGPYGLEGANPNPNWYKSGGPCNLRFLHEYQHLCYRSNTGGHPNNPDVSIGWPNEFFSTAAEYLVGVDPDSSYLWQPQNDLPCDQSLLGVWGDNRNAYAMWRLFAAYLLQQFNTDESEYEDDLVYQWARTVSPADTTRRGLYQLGEVLADQSKPWHSKLASGGSTGMGKLCALFQDWSIAKALDDTTRLAHGDELTLGFGRGLSPRQDLGLFRDIDTAAANSCVLPNEFVVDSTSLVDARWVKYYRHPSDSARATFPFECDTTVKLPYWAADYILFTPSSYFEDGPEGPYDLRVLIREWEGEDNILPLAAQGQQLQVSVVTYSSAENVFKSGEDVIGVSKLSITQGRGKASITIPDFGDSVKAALIIVGLTGKTPLVTGDRGPYEYGTWNYRYAYWVASPPPVSGSISGNMIWADSVFVGGDVTVEEGASLWVEPGTHVKIAEACSLKVVGALDAIGSSNEPILLASAGESPAAGDWPGLYCSGTVEMESCSLKYAGTGIAVTDGGVLALDGCWITDYADYGLDISGYQTEVEVSYTRLEGDSSTAGVIVSEAASVSLDACTVSSFSQYGADVTGPDTRLEASGTTFQAGRSTGGVRGDSAASITLDGCTIDGEPQYCVYISGDEDTLYMSGSNLETKRKDGIAVRLLGGPRAIITSSSITGDADSLTYGIKSDAGAGGNAWLALDDVEIADVKYGVYASQTELNAEACHVDSFSTAGIYFLGSGSWNCSLERSRLDGAKSGATGIYVSNASNTTLWRDTVECLASGDKSGIELIGAGQGNLGPAVVESCYVSGFQNDLYASYMDLTVSYSTFSSFTNDGIKASGTDVAASHNTVSIGSTGVRGIELASGTTGTVDHNNITCTDGSGLRYGILSSTDGIVDLEYNWLEGMKCGVKCSGSSDPSISGNRIRYTTGNGIQCLGEAYPTIRYTTVEHFKGSGIAVGDCADPNMGTSPDSGSCRVYSDSTFSYYVTNLTEYTTMTELNWWGTSSPSSSKFYGDVDYSPPCQSDPGTHYALPMIAQPSRGLAGPYALQSYPNPFNPRTTIEYGVSEPGTRVTIAVYDISGRVVKVLVNGARPVGHHTAVWDGTDDIGRAVASGVYFSEVVIGEFRESRKLVVLR